MLEYNDCLNRCKRLSASCDLIAESDERKAGRQLSGGRRPTSLVEAEDVGVVLRWLVYHQGISRKASCFIAVSYVIKISISLIDLACIDSLELLLMWEVLKITYWV